MVLIDKSITMSDVWVIREGRFCWVCDKHDAG